MNRFMRWVVLWIAKKAKPLLRMRLGRFVDGVVKYPGWRAGNLAVVSCGIEVENAEAGFEEVDTGYKGRALDAVFIQVVWVAVGSCDEDYAVAHQPFKEPGNIVLS